VTSTHADTTQLSVTVFYTRTDVAVVTVAGELDFPAADDLRAEIASAFDRPPATVTVDLGGLTFIDSTGLSVLVHAWRRGNEAGVPVTLRNVPPFAASVLEITGVAELFARSPARRDAGKGTAAIA
jgi:anti-anti-sigma factor